MFRYWLEPTSWLSAGHSLLTGRRFRPFRFKFWPKRSDFGRKKLRTAETGFGFRLSEVIPYLGERGAAFGGLQGVELENGFYPYSGPNSRNAPSAAVMACCCCIFRSGRSSRPCRTAKVRRLTATVPPAPAGPGSRCCRWSSRHATQEAAPGCFRRPAAVAAVRGLHG